MTTYERICYEVNDLLRRPELFNNRGTVDVPVRYHFESGTVFEQWVFRSGRVNRGWRAFTPTTTPTGLISSSSAEAVLSTSNRRLREPVVDGYFEARTPTGNRRGKRLLREIKKGFYRTPVVRRRGGQRGRGVSTTRPTPPRLYVATSREQMNKLCDGASNQIDGYNYTDGSMYIFESREPLSRRTYNEMNRWRRPTTVEYRIIEINNAGLHWLRDNVQPVAANSI